ncbi:unnamed protein product [Lepidochelys kempii]
MGTDETNEWMFSSCSANWELGGSLSPGAARELRDVPVSLLRVGLASHAPTPGGEQPSALLHSILQSPPSRAPHNWGWARTPPDGATAGAPPVQLVLLTG